MPIHKPILKKLFLFQYGDYRFFKTGQALDYSFTDKPLLLNSPFGDGQSNLRGMEENPKEDYDVNVTFAVSHDHSYRLDVVKNILIKTKPEKIFFVEKQDNGEYKIFYNYATCVGYSEESGFNMSYSQNIVSKTVSFRLQTPYFYEVTNEVDILRYDNLVESDIKSWDDGVTTWDNGNIWDSLEIALSSSYSQLSSLEKDWLFGSCNSDSAMDVRLAYTDYYNNSNIFAINETDGVTVTIANNEPNLVNYTQDLTAMTADSDICIVKIPQIAQDQFVEIRNTANGSGFRFTWISDQVMPTSVLLRTHKAQVIDLETNQIILISDQKYRLEQTGNSLLKFKSRLPTNNILNQKQSNVLETLKNTGSSLDIFIKTVLTYN